MQLSDLNPDMEAVARITQDMQKLQQKIDEQLQERNNYIRLKT